MKLYTKEEFDCLKNLAVIEFTAIKEKSLKEYSTFLDKLFIKDFEVIYKLNRALDEKEYIKQSLHTFIQNKYPKTDEIPINGLFVYTLETSIYFKLMVDEMKQADNQFQKLYQYFYLKNFPEHTAPEI